jgi:DNA-binding MarR family transcriptional regulator
VERRYIGSLVDARVQVFAVDERGRAHAPVNADGFGYIYDVSNENLRDTFRYAQDFALDHDPAFFLESTPTVIESELMTWVDNLAEKAADDVRLQRRMWRLLEDLAKAGGTAAPGDHESFGFNDRTHMRKNVVELERFDLAVSSRDEVDGRRRSISLTSKGWLVHFAKKRDLLAQGALDLSPDDDDGAGE